MKPVEVPPMRPDDTTLAPLAPKSPEAHKVLYNASATHGRGDNGEDGVGGEFLLLFREGVCPWADAVPEAKVEGYRHGDGVEEDEGPEQSDCCLAGAEGVV